MSPSIKVALLTEQGAPHLDIYLDCIAEAAGVSEVVVADTSGHIFEAASRKLGGRFGSIPMFTNINHLFRDHKPHMAIASFPASSAPAAIEIALRQGCHVLAEKPACVRVEDFERLAGLAQERGLNLMLALATRMNPIVTTARERIQSGLLGKLYGASMYFLADQARLQSSTYQQSWMASRARAGGGHLIWLGIHYLDAIQFITGQRIVKICGFTENAGAFPMDVEDSASVSMQLDGGLLATLQSGYYLDRGYQSQIHLWGTSGWLKADLVSGAPLRWYSNENGGIESIAQVAHPQLNVYLCFIQAVIDAVRLQTDPPITIQESLQALKAVFGLYRSASNGQSFLLDI